MGSCTLEDRIIQYVRTGNHKMIQALYGIGFLESYDIFDIEGSGKHDGYLILEIVARYPIPNYKEMIDIEYDFSCLLLSSFNEETKRQIKENGNYWGNRLTGKNWY